MTKEQPIPDRDDRISAYLDGALSAAEMQSFEAEMERDPVLADAVGHWLANDAALKSAFEAPMHEPVTDEMLTRFGLADRPAASNVIDFRVARDAKVEQNRARNFGAQWRWPLAGALAASLVAVVTFGTRVSNDAPFDINRSKSFQVAMQDSPSNVTRRVENGQDVSPTLSFVDGAGRFCREFAVSGQESQKSGIACKTDDKWHIEAIVKGRNALPDAREIQTAGGAEGSSLNSAYERLRASDPLGIDEEKALITKGWEK
jgi:hypothetical protein